MDKRNNPSRNSWVTPQAKKDAIINLEHRKFFNEKLSELSQKNTAPQIKKPNLRVLKKKKWDYPKRKEFIGELYESPKSTIQETLDVVKVQKQLYS